MDRPARVHVLYLERAEDQRTSDGKRSAGLHLEQTPGLGPYICTTCDAVADTWRNRCDNFQCALRMCCAEGALFRPSVAQFAVLSPRAALAYELPAFGAWMAAQGTKRPTEALVVGAALRVVAGTLAPAECGVTHVPLACDSDGEGDAMWAWAAQWAAAVRASAAGKVVTLLLEAGAPPLVPSPIAGALAAHLGATAPPTDYIILVGGPSGVPAAWRSRVQRAVGTTLLKVALRGGLQHAAPALLELLLVNERGELGGLVMDRLAVPPEQHKAWRRAERELLHAWLRRLGVSAPATGNDAAQAAGSDEQARAQPAETVGSLLGAHRMLMQQVAAGAVHGAAPEESMLSSNQFNSSGAATLPSPAPAVQPVPPPQPAIQAVPPPQPVPPRQGAAGGAADGHHKRKRRKVHSAGDGASSVPKH